jgi:cation diffusion facilitator CzcD-associated flavoprotein CzcO
MTVTCSHSDEHHDVVVIGAGPAGLATAAALARGGVEALVVDRGEQVGTSWRGHYDRLHLHTVRWLSHLPGLQIPAQHIRDTVFFADCPHHSMGIALVVISVPTGVRR